MKSIVFESRVEGKGVLIAYGLIVLAALVFDLLTDRSFGALMFSVLPISVIALGCMLIGPWLRAKNRKIAFRNWFMGAVLTLIIVLAFSSMGAEQAKTGELIFIYALLALAFPLSLILPFVMNSTEFYMRDSFGFRLLFGWIISIAAGGIQWQILGLLFDKFIRSRSKSA